MGWIAKDDRGELIRAVNLRFVGLPGSHLAEAVGIKEALSWIKSIEVSYSLNTDQQVCCRYMVKSDCQGVVDTILSKERILSPYGGIIDDCRSIIEMLNNI